MIRNRFVLSFGTLMLISTTIAPRGASAGWLVGSTMTINVDDSPLGTSFTQDVTLGAAFTVLDQGELTLTQTLVPAGPNAEWLILDYQATGNYLIGANPDINWDYSAIAQTSSPTVLSNWFFNWTVNGALVNTITNDGAWSGVGPDPLDPSLGNVFNYSASFDPATSWNLFSQIYPYSDNGDSGLDVSATNGFVFGGMVTNASVPEPSSLVLCGIASVMVVFGMRARSRAD